MQISSFMKDYYVNQRPRESRKIWVGQIILYPIFYFINTSENYSKTSFVRGA